MAKFRINGDVNAQISRDVEAVKFRHVDGYFVFFGSGDSLVYSITDKQVFTIERVDEKSRS